jgi:3-oxoacyl-[acyl-carrier protein] reductase
MSNKVVLITGASRGIGKAIAVALAENGWSVGINYQNNRQAAEDVLRIVTEQDGIGLLLKADVSNAADRQYLIDTMMDHFGQIDLLINNAGIAPRHRQDLLKIGEDSFNEVLDVNLKGPFFLTQSVSQIMIKLLNLELISEPRIINISSISAYTSSPSRGEYCISKAGMTMMTALYADRLAEYGIGVYEIRPGIIQTDMTESVKDKYDHLISSGLTPIRRWGQPEDITRAVVAIADGFFPFSTGEVFNVDGGFHIRKL